MKTTLEFRLLYFFVIAINFWCAPVHALVYASDRTQVRTEQVHAQLLAHASEGVAPGKSVWLGLQLTHQPQWHSYWKNPGDSGLPTQLQWTLPAGMHAGDIAWPVPHKIAIGDLANLGYEGTVLLAVPITVDANFRPPAQAHSVDIALHASWLVCKEACVPQEGDFAISLPLQGATVWNADAFATAQRLAPPLWTAPVQASAQIMPMGTGHALHLSVSHLPAAWRGKALNAFVETPEVLDTPRLPASSDAVITGQAERSGTQAWSTAADARWSAWVPLASQRSTAPRTLHWVLTLGESSGRISTPVTGTWPAVAASAELPPALQAALQTAAERNANGTPQETTWGLAFALALLGALAGGVVLNGMPCVFPVLAIKVLAFAQHTTPAQARRQGLAYSVGVVLSMLALGGTMLALRSAGAQWGWGFQLQSPTVLALLALLFTLLGLHLIGAWEVGHLLPSRWASAQLQHPLADAFLSGVLAVAIASPCSAPFMGASLGYAITLPALEALCIFAALGLGLALPYLLASLLSSRWPALVQALPKPGAWMQTLRQAMAFPMWATVLWLLWVLGQVNGLDSALGMLALLLGVAFTVWAAGLHGRSRTVCLALALGLWLALLPALGPHVIAGDTAAPLSTTQTEANANAPTAATPWQAWSPQRVEAALAAGQPVLVDFTAAWCITCQFNKKTTLSRPEVLADLAAKQVLLLRADWTRRDPRITAALAQLGRSSVPVNVLYAPGQPPLLFSELLSASALRQAAAALPAR